jgi:hypothetical protein
VRVLEGVPRDFNYPTLTDRDTGSSLLAETMTMHSVMKD